ncbi:MAG TPA: recombinase family protein [Candidatus Acidoferrales bacterium]|nr:recombinase family protein [Candidatus Acidoferrales bacterium]
MNEKGDRPNSQTSNLGRRSVVYARVSSKEQEKEGYSIPAQLKSLRSYAVGSKLQIMDEFIDVETAKEAGRLGFARMLDHFKKNRSCKILLVEKTDRLYRNLKDWVTIDELDLEIHFVKENVILSGDSRSSEKFMHGIKVLMAKNYIDNLSEETRKGMSEKAAQGFWPSCAPLGYRNVTAPNGKRVIEPDPTLAPIITRMFERYATGEFSLADMTKISRSDGMVFRKSNDAVPRATINKILRNRLYTGDFNWDGRTYAGIHAPLVTKDLWERVQEALDSRRANRHRKVKHDFAFSGLISCGHCGCALVGEIKKGKYVYYHCTGYKGKCPEPYTREEVLEEQFGYLLNSLVLDAEILGWVKEALRQSHGDAKRHHAAAIVRLQSEYDRLQSRVDAMYVDKLDGRIDTVFFDRKSSEWRVEQERLLQSIHEHQNANQTYLDEGIRLLELSQRARSLFQKQEPREKRRLLNFLLSNCSWKDEQLKPVFRQPFDMLADANSTYGHQQRPFKVQKADFENWLPGLDSN